MKELQRRFSSNVKSVFNPWWYDYWPRLVHFNGNFATGLN